MSHWDHTVIVNSSFKGNSIMKHLPFTKIMHSAIKPHFIFTNSSPSLALCIFDVASISSDMILCHEICTSIQELQQSFKNFFVILQDESSLNDTFQIIQSRIVGGNARLLQSRNEINSVEIIKFIYITMTDKKNLQSQATFFEQWRASLTSSEIAQDIFLTSLNDVGVNQDDSQMFLESLGSISNLMMAPRETLEEIPVDDISIEQVVTYFN